MLALLRILSVPLFFTGLFSLWIFGLYARKGIWGVAAGPGTAGVILLTLGMYFWAAPNRRARQINLLKKSQNYVITKFKRVADKSATEISLVYLGKVGVRVETEGPDPDTHQIRRFYSPFV